MTLGYEQLDGARPSRDVVDRLRSALAAEQRGLIDIRSARVAVVESIHAARLQGASYTAIAAALVNPTGDIYQTLMRRARLANSLRARVFEARARGGRDG